MVGGGIFAVLGLAVVLAGGGAPASFLVGGGVALLTAYAYAKLSVAYPSRGGTVVFVDRAFGVDWATGSLNNLLWISYIVALSLYAVAFANYAATFFAGQGGSVAPLTQHALISGGILVPALLNVTSASLVSRMETYVVGIKLAILLAVVAFGLTSIDASRIAPSTWESPAQIVGAAMLMFVAYEGFELIANAVPDLKDRARTAPRAYYGSVGFVVVLYVLIAIVTVGALSPDQMSAAADFALAEAARPSMGHWGFTLVAASAVLATFSAINATLFASARLSVTIAEEGELPAFLKRKVWNQPLMGLLLTTAAALLLANVADLSSISTMGSAGFLLIFAAVNAACWRKAKEIGASRTVAALGTLACVAALGVLVWHTAQSAPSRLWVLAAMVGLAGVVEFFVLRRRPSQDG